MNLKQKLQSGIVLMDGAMGTELHNYNPSEEDYGGLLGCSEILNETRPDWILDIHRSYLKAGSDIIETNTFGSNEIVLDDYNIAHRARELSALGAKLARQAIDEFEGDRYALGSMGPGTKLISLGQTQWSTMYHSYQEHARGLVDGGVDGFLVETCQDPLQIKCALAAIESVQDEMETDLPVVVSVTVETTGTLLVGTEIHGVLAALQPFDIAALGLNCATGPRDMKPYIQVLSNHWRGPIIVQPNAGLPKNVDGKMVYTLSVGEYLNTMGEFMDEDGVSVVGGCCGTNPQFIAALRSEVDRRISESAQDKGTRRPKPIPMVASVFGAQDMAQEPRPFFIGERTNTNGSKAFREALLKEDFEAILDIAREQQESGVHGLDLCVAYTGRDEVRDMERAMQKIVTSIQLPLFIDSTELPVIERALQMYGGRAIINSINLEDGEAKADAICTLAKRYGAGLIALTIDEKGMAKDAPSKLAIAQRIYDIAVNRHGLNPEDLIFDPLTFTLGSGDESMKTSALETMKGIRLIKDKLPGVFTVLGLSNVSFGLSKGARKVLNSVFLDRCVQAGLDFAIVNLAHIKPLAGLAQDDVAITNELIDNGRPNVLFEFIDHFAAKAGEVDEDQVETESMTTEELIFHKVVKGSKSDLEPLLMEEKDNRPAMNIINDILIPAMRHVGDLFGSGKMQLPFVLQSAEVMKKSVDILEPFLEKIDGEEQFKVVLATVRGDVHDIGKNLVDIILSNNGYKVYNIGIKAEIDTILHKAEEVGADAIGLSGLLVKSTIVMKDNLEEMQRRGIKTPVLLGGAALTPSYVYEVCKPAHGGDVIYCADAFEGLKSMNLLKEGKLAEYSNACEEKFRSRKPRTRRKVEAEERQVVRRDVDIPEPPFWGVKIVDDIGLETVYQYLTEEVIFRGRWGYRRGTLAKEEYEKLIEETVRPQFEQLKALALKEERMTPKVAYGYFPVNSQGQDVIVYSPEDMDREIGRFTFPRQEGGAQMCIADYFLPIEEGHRDVMPLQVATVGSKAQEICQSMYQANEYKDYLLFHGLSVETAEALAEYWHLVVRQEMGITGEDGSGIQDFVVQKYRGSRYSFGYPACPDLAQNRLLCNLVNSEAIGVTLSEEEQMVPEQTTSAFVVHHPQAKYFTI